LSELQRIPVDADDYGMMLLDYLERLWPDVHRAYFRRQVLAGLVRVNRIVGTPYTRLRNGDFIDMPKVEGRLPPRKAGPRARSRSSNCATATTRWRYSRSRPA
jgi:hypothetical protein